LAATGEGETPAPVLAPLKGGELVATVGALRRGDLVVCLGDGLPQALQEAGLVASAHELGRVRVSLLSREASSLEDLCVSGARLGSGARNGPLGRAAESLLAEDLGAALSANTVHRTERSDELIRLLGLGALDGAFVWHPGVLPAGLREVPLPRNSGAGSCPLTAVVLACSDRRSGVLDRLVSAWCGAQGRAALSGLGVASRGVSEGGAE
jgi:hypothetical protein